MKLTNTRQRALLLSSLGAALLLTAPAAKAAVVGFDELAHNLPYQTSASVSSGGFDFANNGGSGSIIIWGKSNASNADPGGATLGHNHGFTTTTMTKSDGGSFSLTSIDFGDVYNQAYNIQKIQIVGTKADLSTVTHTVTTDALAGLETFLFADFDDLIAVAWTTISGTANGYLQVDNVVVDGVASSVPEPMSLSLFAGGLAALAVQRRRRKTVA
jgi:hypothetical protein